MAQLSSNSNSSRASWGVLSDYRDVLYGIAIALIVLFHLYESTVKGTAVHSALWLFNRMSAGVDAFRCARDQRPLEFLGRISLEMYIVNVAGRTVVQWYWGDYFFATKSNLAQLEYCAVIVAVTVLGAWALHKAMEPVVKRLVGR